MKVQLSKPVKLEVEGAEGTFGQLDVASVHAHDSMLQAEVRPANVRTIVHQQLDGEAPFRFPRNKLSASDKKIVADFEELMGRLVKNQIESVLK